MRFLRLELSEFWILEPYNLPDERHFRRDIRGYWVRLTGVSFCSPSEAGFVHRGTTGSVGHASMCLGAAAQLHILHIISDKTEGNSALQD